MKYFTFFLNVNLFLQNLRQWKTLNFENAFFRHLWSVLFSLAVNRFVDSVNQM